MGENAVIPRCQIDAYLEPVLKTWRRYEAACCVFSQMFFRNDGVGFRILADAYPGAKPKPPAAKGLYILSGYEEASLSL